MTTTDPKFPELAGDDDGAPPPPPGGTDTPARPSGWAHRKRRRWTKVVALVVVLVLLVPAISLGRALTASNNLSVGERAAEWARDNHLGPVVDKVENWWYSNHAPAAGGEPDRAIDTGDATPTTEQPPAPGKGPAHLAAPAPVPVPDGVDPLPDEGRWEARGPLVGGVPGIYTTQVRPDSVHTSLLSGLAWMDPQLLRFEYHPGTTEPGGSWGGVASQVPTAERLDLVAAFNSAFRLQDAEGGVYLNGETKGELRDGAASFVVYDDGTATVGAWGRDVTMTPHVVAVRQNLSLIIDNGGGPPNDAGRPAAAASPGVAAAGLDDNANGAWGDTLGNKVLVWRSAVCVTGSGAVVYGYGDGLGALSLAELMTRAGCVRAMELDINRSWTTFNLYAAGTPDDPGSVAGGKLLPEQVKGANRYLSDDARDFFAVLERKS